MATLSAAQIAGYAKAAGFTGGDIATITAIALAESGGNPHAYNGKGLDRSYGLTQVNMIGSLGPSRRRRFGLSSNSDLFNPGTNLKVAYGLSNGGKNFTPWTTYTSGKYRAYLDAAKKGAGNPDTSGGTTNAQQVGAISGLSDIGGFFEFITDPDTWLRFGMLVAGGILLLIALAGLSGTTGRLSKAVGTITDILPQTKGLKTAAKVA